MLQACFLIHRNSISAVYCCDYYRCYHYELGIDTNHWTLNLYPGIRCSESWPWAKVQSLSTGLTLFRQDPDREKLSVTGLPGLTHTSTSRATLIRSPGSSRGPGAPACFCTNPLQKPREISSKMGSALYSDRLCQTSRNGALCNLVWGSRVKKCN